MSTRVLHITYNVICYSCYGKISSDKSLSLVRKFTWRSILTLSRGETQVLDTAPATPPAMICFTCLLPGKTAFFAGSALKARSSPSFCTVTVDWWISLSATWAESFRTILSYFKLHFHFPTKRLENNPSRLSTILNRSSWNIAYMTTLPKFSCLYLDQSE